MRKEVGREGGLVRVCGAGCSGECVWCSGW